MRLEEILEYNNEKQDFKMFSNIGEKYNEIDIAIDKNLLQIRTNNGYTLIKEYQFDELVMNAFYVKFVSYNSPSLCVHLLDRMEIFHEGDSFCITFPCIINSCIPCDGYILLEKNNYAENSNLPTLFSLFHPLEELKPISFNSYNDPLKGERLGDFFNDTNFSILVSANDYILMYEKEEESYYLWKTRIHRQVQYLESVTTPLGSTTVLEVSYHEDNQVITSDVFLNYIWCGKLEDVQHTCNEYTLFFYQNRIYMSCQTNRTLFIYSPFDSNTEKCSPIFSVPSISSIIIQINYFPSLWLILSPEYTLSLYFFSIHSILLPFSPIRNFQTPIKPNLSFSVQSPGEIDEQLPVAPPAYMHYMFSIMNKEKQGEVNPVKLKNSINNSFNMIYSNSRIKRSKIHMFPNNSTIRDCLLVFHSSMPMNAALSMRFSFLDYLEMNNSYSEWEIWEYFILQIFGIELVKPSSHYSDWEKLANPAILSKLPSSSQFQQYTRVIWETLHMIWEVKRLNNENPDRAILLLYKISWGTQQKEYHEFYERRIYQFTDFSTTVFSA